MKHDTQKEIGELIEEIAAKGFQLELDVDDSEGSRLVNAECWNEEYTPSCISGAATIAEALGFLVDSIRRHRGEPSREEELAALLAADASHAAAPPVVIGPDASCGCGSRKPLILERRIKLEVPWSTGQPKLDRLWGLLGIEGLPTAGEIGTCPDCGRNYTFRA